MPKKSAIFVVKIRNLHALFENGKAGEAGVVLSSVRGNIRED